MENFDDVKKEKLTTTNKEGSNMDNVVDEILKQKIRNETAEETSKNYHNVVTDEMRKEAKDFGIALRDADESIDRFNELSENSIERLNISKNKCKKNQDFIKVEISETQDKLAVEANVLNVKRDIFFNELAKLRTSSPDLAYLEIDSAEEFLNKYSAPVKTDNTIKVGFWEKTKNLAKCYWTLVIDWGLSFVALQTTNPDNDWHFTLLNIALSFGFIGLILIMDTIIKNTKGKLGTRVSLLTLFAGGFIALAVYSSMIRMGGLTVDINTFNLFLWLRFLSLPIMVIGFGAYSLYKLNEFRNIDIEKRNKQNEIDQQFDLKVKDFERKKEYCEKIVLIYKPCRISEEKIKNLEVLIRVKKESLLIAEKHESDINVQLENVNSTKSPIVRTLILEFIHGTKDPSTHIYPPERISKVQERAKIRLKEWGGSSELLFNNLNNLELV